MFKFVLFICENLEIYWTLCKNCLTKDKIVISIGTLQASGKKIGVQINKTMKMNGKPRFSRREIIVVLKYIKILLCKSENGSDDVTFFCYSIARVPNQRSLHQASGRELELGTCIARN